MFDIINNETDIKCIEPFAKKRIQKIYEESMVNEIACIQGTITEYYGAKALKGFNFEINKEIPFAITITYWKTNTDYKQKNIIILEDLYNSNLTKPYLFEIKYVDKNSLTYKNILYTYNSNNNDRLKNKLIINPEPLNKETFKNLLLEMSDNQVIIACEDK